MKSKIHPEQVKAARRAGEASVAILTRSHDGIVDGMRTNSFNAIALSPPTVLIAVQQQSRTQHLIREGGVFGVSILNTSQANLVKQFARQTKKFYPGFLVLKHLQWSPVLH